MPKEETGNVLLWIISRVSENTREEAASNAVAALDDKAVAIGIHEGRIHEEQPNSVEKLSLTPPSHFVGGRTAIDTHICICEGVGELQKDKSNRH